MYLQTQEKVTQRKDTVNEDRCFDQTENIKSIIFECRVHIANVLTVFFFFAVIAVAHLIAYSNMFNTFSVKTGEHWRFTWGNSWDWSNRYIDKMKPVEKNDSKKDFTKNYFLYRIKTQFLLIKIYCHRYCRDSSNYNILWLLRVCSSDKL